MSTAALERIETLVSVGLRIVRSAPTGRVGLARIAESLDPEWIPRPAGDQIAAELAAAHAAALEPLNPHGVEHALLPLRLPRRTEQ